MILLKLQSDSGEIRPTFVDEENNNLSEGSEFQQTHEDELLATQTALADARAREQAFEKERGLLLEKLARAEAKKHEYEAAIMHEKELVIEELEAAKDLFHKKLQESVDEKFDLESKLILAKQDAVELAVQVEKLAEIAFQQATSHILDDAQLRVSAAETSAADATYQIEEQIRSATEGTMLSIVDQSKSAIAKALAVAKAADNRAKNYAAAPADDSKLIDEIASIKFHNVKLQQEMYDLGSQLLVSENEINKLKSELDHSHQQATGYEFRACDAEKKLVEIQESSRKSALKQEEELKSLLDKVKEDAVERGKATSKAFKAELETLKAAIEAAKETARSKDDAYLRRCEALQRSLRASESASMMWRQRAKLVETLLLKQVPLGETDDDLTYVVNGGRVELLMDDDSKKLKLLTDGPRREIPEWMLRRIQSICPRFPPRKASLSEAKISNFKSLELPKPDEIWSIALEKPKEGDTLVEHVMEKEVIEKKRKALERALQRKTVQWQKTAEETKIGIGPLIYSHMNLYF